MAGRGGAMAKQQASLTLDNIGRSVRAGLALALPEEPAVRAGRARFIAAVHLPHRRSWRWVYGVVAGATAAAALMVWFAWQRPPASGFMAAGAPGRLGAMLRSGEAVVPVRFEGGSAIDLGPQSQLQVARFDPEQAHLRLTHGRVHLSIHKKGRRTWALDAGPFRV